MLYIVTGKRGAGKTGFLTWQATHDANRGRVVISDIKTGDARLIHTTDLPSFRAIVEIRDAGRPLTVLIDNGDRQLGVWQAGVNKLAKWVGETLTSYSRLKAGSCDIYIAAQNPHLLTLANEASLRFEASVVGANLRVEVQQPPDWRAHHEFNLDWPSILELIQPSETVVDIESQRRSLHDYY